jgi:hypothetical protein
MTRVDPIQELVDTYTENGALHHAYCIEGEREGILVFLHDFFEKKLHIKTVGNPDFFSLNCDNFGISDGRILQERASKKALVGSSLQLYVLSMNSITTEAQNALLKLFEEPASGIHFFVIAPNVEIFLPTLRSRLMIISALKHNTISEIAEQFIKVNAKKRMALLKEIIDTKNKATALSLLNDIEIRLHDKIHDQKIDSASIQALKEIQKCRGYLRDRSPSIKMIMEHIALTIPCNN